MECVYCEKAKHCLTPCGCETVLYCSDICKRAYAQLPLAPCRPIGVTHKDLCEKFKNVHAPNSVFIRQDGVTTMENACNDDLYVMADNMILDWAFATTIVIEGIRYAVESGSPMVWKKNSLVKRFYGDIIVTRDTGCFETIRSSECPEGPLSKILHTPEEIISAMQKRFEKR